MDIDDLSGRPEFAADLFFKEDLGGGALFLYLSIFQHYNLIGQPKYFRQVVADEDRRQSVEPVCFSDEVLQLEAHIVVDGGEGFVQEQQGGAAGDGAGEGCALLLAAGQEGGFAVLQLLQLHHFEELVNDLAVGFFGEGKLQLLAHRQVGEEGEVLEDKADGTGLCGEPGGAGWWGEVAGVEPGLVIHFNITCVCIGEAGKDAKDGGFTGSGGAVEGEEAAFFELEADVEQLSAGCSVKGFGRLKVEEARGGLGAEEAGGSLGVGEAGGCIHRGDLLWR